MTDTAVHADLKTFAGGIHPTDDGKALSKDCAIEPAPVPDEVCIFLGQHIGAPAGAVVAKGDVVIKGQIIGEPQGFVSASVHASIPGKVVALEDRPHPTQGKPSPAIVIERDGDVTWPDDGAEPADLESLSADDIKDRIQEAGIVGLGGATFPTHVKLSPPPDKPIDLFLLNGAECEPYITADYRLMMEQPKPVLLGMKLIMKCLGVETGIVGIEANKPDAYETMKSEAEGMDDITVEMLEVKYPQGAEHQLIKALGRRDLRGRALPMEVGAVVQNIATAKAVYEACAFGRPLVERVVTVTGSGVDTPRNFVTPVGTSIQALLDAVGLKDRANKVLFGGPMMGVALPGVDGMVTLKGTNSVLVVADAESWEHRACIRCGKCVANCPYGLNPSQLSIQCEAGRYLDTDALNIMDCKECGCCTFGCPSKRPIVQMIRLAKAHLAAEKARREAEEKGKE